MTSVEAAEDGLGLLSPHHGLLLAVSGGPDSVALMLLCANWRARAGREISVATVDHGLRPSARAEAEQVSKWARALGFSHHLLVWEGEKPSTRIQERARDARYALLAGCANAIGASAIVTAHHADDQAETVLFRLTRGSGVSGLAGMSARSRLSGLTLLRPLLGMRKAALVDICRAAGHGFFTDPSNEDESYARARLRRLLPLLSEQGLDTEALLRLSARAARADEALAACAQAARLKSLIEASDAFARFDSGALREFPLELLQRLLANEIERIEPRAQLRLDRLERAALRISQMLRAGGTLRLTLANILVETAPSDVTLGPAPPRRNGRRSL